jgi:hypothetical protein
VGAVVVFARAGVKQETAKGFSLMNGERVVPLPLWRKRDKDCGSLLDSSTWWRDDRAENHAG